MPLCRFAWDTLSHAWDTLTVRIRELSALMHIARPRDRDFCHQVHLGGAALARFKQRTVALAAVLEAVTAHATTRGALTRRRALRPHAPPAAPRTPPARMPSYLDCLNAQ